MKNRKLHTTLTLTAIAGVLIHLGNRYISRQSCQKDMLGFYNYSYYNWKHGRIFYTRKGNGKPLLLIHDLIPGGSAYEWIRVEEALAENHTVYTLDLPGCGRSEKNAITYTNFLFTQMLTSFVKDVIRAKTDVVVCGSSVSIISMANLYEKNFFRRIILVNPVNIHGMERSVSSRGKVYKKLVELPVFGTLIYNLHVSRDSITSKFLNDYYHNPFRVDKDILDACYEGAHRGGYNSKFLYASLAAGYLNVPDLGDSIENLPRRVLLLSGEYEKNRERIERQYLQKKPDIQTGVIRGTKHLPHIEKPEEFVKTVDDFLL